MLLPYNQLFLYLFLINSFLYYPIFHLDYFYLFNKLSETRLSVIKISTNLFFTAASIASSFDNPPEIQTFILTFLKSSRSIPIILLSNSVSTLLPFLLKNLKQISPSAPLDLISSITSLA